MIITQYINRCNIINKLLIVTSSPLYIYQYISSSRVIFNCWIPNRWFQSRTCSKSGLRDRYIITSFRNYISSSHRKYFLYRNQSCISPVIAICHIPPVLSCLAFLHVKGIGTTEVLFCSHKMSSVSSIYFTRFHQYIVRSVW